MQRQNQLCLSRKLRWTYSHVADHPKFRYRAHHPGSIPRLNIETKHPVPSPGKAFNFTRRPGTRPDALHFECLTCLDCQPVCPVSSLSKSAARLSKRILCPNLHFRQSRSYKSTSSIQSAITFRVITELCQR